MSEKPMRVLRSGLTGRVYAFKTYQERDGGLIVATGQKWDVTDDVQALIDDAVLRAIGGAPTPPGEVPA